MADTANNSSDGFSTDTAAASGATPDSGHGISISVGTLAVVILLIVMISKRDQKKSTGLRVPPVPGTAAPPTATVQSPLSQLVSVVFAAVVRATQARTAGGRPEQAAALFHGAVMCWTGSEPEWGWRAAKMDLPQLPSWSPEGDDRVIATYRAELPADKIPHNFLGIQRSLNKLASNGSLKSGALYGRPVGIDPSRFGFKGF